jgi:hypothetical protein
MMRIHLKAQGAHGGIMRFTLGPEFLVLSLGPNGMGMERAANSWKVWQRNLLRPFALAWDVKS